MAFSANEDSDQPACLLIRLGMAIVEYIHVARGGFRLRRLRLTSLLGVYVVSHIIYTYLYNIKQYFMNLELEFIK